MTIEIVVDAKIIISALIGGSSRKILFDHRFRFMTTKFTVGEVVKYIPEISRKSNTDEKFVLETFKLIPIEILEEDYYINNIEGARKLIQDIDRKDVHILALALETENYPWSEDKDFEKAGYKKLLKTKDLF